MDVVLDSADYLEQSLLWLASVVHGEITVARASEIDRGDAWDAALAARDSPSRTARRTAPRPA